MANPEKLRSGEEPVENEGFSETAIINGIEIRIYSVPGLESKYEISFPQIDIGDETRTNGVSDQVIEINGDILTADHVFEGAKRAAETAKDASELYLAVKKIVATQEEIDAQVGEMRKKL